MKRGALLLLEEKPPAERFSFPLLLRPSKKVVLVIKVIQNFTFAGSHWLILIMKKKKVLCSLKGED